MDTIAIKPTSSNASSKIVHPALPRRVTSVDLFRGGWTILALCFFYWLVDVRMKFAEASRFFIIVGMNSIFIYLFFEVGGADLLTEIFTPFTKVLFMWGGELFMAIMTSIVVWGACWYLCYWLYKNRVFIKI